MTPTRLCLIRHGETAWNAQRRVQGQLDLPLNANGIAQARAAAAGLTGERFVALYTSDLSRARHTAEAIAHVLRLQIRLRPALRERHYGVMQSLTYDEGRLRYPEHFARFERRDAGFAFPGGETLLQLRDRVLACIEEIVAANRGQQVLLVTHGGVLDVVNRRARGLALDVPRDFDIPNAAFNWVEASDGEWRISAWAEIGHLVGAADELPR